MDSRIITGEVVECLSLVLAHYSTYCMLHHTEYSTIRNSQTWTPSTTEELAWKCYYYDITKYLLERMDYYLRLREIECLEVVLLFERFVQRAKQHFAVTKESFAMTFTVSMILSNKLNADTPFSNRTWSEVFEIKLDDLCDYECFFVQHVSDQLHMSGDDIRELMSVCVDNTLKTETKALDVSSKEEYSGRITALSTESPHTNGTPVNEVIALDAPLKEERGAYSDSDELAILSQYTDELDAYTDGQEVITSDVSVQAIVDEHVAPLDDKSDTRILLVDELDVLLFGITFSIRTSA